jgi:tRNA-dihydrouridine synthase
LPHNKSENPLVIQIFGKEAEIFVKASQIIAKKKYKIS